MSGFIGNNGNINQQHYTFNDGNIQGHFSSQQYSWGSSQEGVPASTPTRNIAPLQSPSLPHMLPAPDLGQLHQQHMGLHHASMQSALQMQHNMFSSMQANINPVPHYQQPVLMPPQARPQIQYVQQQPQLQPLAIEYGNPSSPQAILQHPNDRQRLPTSQLQLTDSDRDNERREELLRETSKLEARLQRIELSQTHSREQQEAKDRELAAARAREQHLHRQLLEAEQRHGHALASVAQSHALTPRAANQDFDIHALQRLIAEVQVNNISKEDIRQLVEDTVSKQISGVAKTSDIESAASRMEKGLVKLPMGASASDIQQTVQQELEKAVQKVARHMPARQRSIEEGFQQVGSSNTPVVTVQQPRTELQSLTPVTTEALSQLLIDGGSEIGHRKSSMPKSRASAVWWANNSPDGVEHQDSTPKKASKKATTSVQPSDRNAIVRHGQDESQRYKSSAQAMAVRRSKGSEMSEYGGEVVVDGLPDNFPDNVSQISGWQRKRSSKSRMSDGGTVDKIRPRNDRRLENVPSSLRQIEEAPEQEAAGMALVKQSKDLSKRSHR